MKIEGRIIKYGDNINTDEIIPAVYLVTVDAHKLGEHCMEGIDKEFTKKVKSAPIVVAGNNFGCGSSREHAPVALVGAGVKCVVAASFARIFFRNAINTGLIIIESKECAEKSFEGDLLQIDTDQGTIKNRARDTSFAIAKYPDFIQRLIKEGGIDNWVKSSIQEKI